MILLDTNILSELRKADGGRADARVMEWAATLSSRETFLSVVVVFELERGVLLMERRDPSQGAALRDWLQRRVLEKYSVRILPIDTEIARRAAALHVPKTRPERDAMIAATALAHGMAVATPNVADFAGTGVRVVNPWDPA